MYLEIDTMTRISSKFPNALVNIYRESRAAFMFSGAFKQNDKINKTGVVEVRFYGSDLSANTLSHDVTMHAVRK